MTRSKKNRGASLLELIVYMGLAATVLIVIVGSLLAVTSAYQKLKINRDINRNALTAMNRLMLEIRSSESVDLGESILAVHPGVLSLKSTDSLGIPLTRAFYLSNGILTVEVGGETEGALTDETVEVSNLIFEHVASSTPQAISITLTLVSGTSTNTQSKTFRNTAVLRGFYKGK